MALRLIDRYHPQRRREQQAVIDKGHLYKIDELALLEGSQLQSLARLSVLLLVVGGVALAVLTILCYFLHYHHFFAPFTFESVVVWIVVSVIGYLLILPLHEGIHGLTFAFWGGRPHFGAKLPLALYCGARDQLFRRDQYLVVGLAPLVVLTLVGIVLIAWVPGIAAYLWFALAGNVSGAAGDVMAARRLQRLPKDSVVEDTETGYVAWCLQDERA
jgi:hypothetical protein